MVLTLTILPTPKARAIVTIAGKPSGIAATAKAIADSNKVRVSVPNFDQSGLAERPILIQAQIIPTTKVAMTMNRQIKPNCLDKIASFFCKGVCSSSAVVSIVAILPTSVFIPVAITIPVPLP